MRCVVCVMSGWPRGAADSLRWLLRMCQRAPGGRSLSLSLPTATATLATAKREGWGRWRGEEGVTRLKQKRFDGDESRKRTDKDEKPALVADGRAVRVPIQALKTQKSTFFC